MDTLSILEMIAFILFTVTIMVNSFLLVFTKKEDRLKHSLTMIGPIIGFIIIANVEMIAEFVTLNLFAFEPLHVYFVVILFAVLYLYLVSPRRVGSR